MYTQEQMILNTSNQYEDSWFSESAFIIDKNQFKEAVSDSIVDATIRILIPATLALFICAVVVFIRQSRM